MTSGESPYHMATSPKPASFRILGNVQRITDTIGKRNNTSMLRQSSVLATAFMLTTATGCRTPDPIAPGTPPEVLINCDLAPAMRPAITDGCPDASCGNNSPVVNAFRYNGLHPDGCRNAERIALVSPSLFGNYSVCNHGGKPLYLDVAPVGSDTERLGYELIARDEHGEKKCTGTQLLGATFQVESRVGKRTTLRISQIGVVPVSDQESMTRTVYLITPAEQPANSLCSSLPLEVTSNASTPFLSSGYNTDNKPSDLRGENFSAYAIIIPGALYSQSAEVIAKSVGSTRPHAAEGHRWFNIACVNDGLAQTELSGLVTAPIVDQETAESRLAALHMFTAKYCGGISATTRGTPIRWMQDDLKDQGDPNDPIEARWGQHGAACLSHSRLWISNKVITLPFDLLKLSEFKRDMGYTLDHPMSESEFLQRLQALCGTNIPPCDDSDASNKLTSYALNHVDTEAILEAVQRRLGSYSSQ